MVAGCSKFDSMLEELCFTALRVCFAFKLSLNDERIDLCDKPLADIGASLCCQRVVLPIVEVKQGEEGFACELELPPVRGLSLRCCNLMQATHYRTSGVENEV